MWTCFRGGICHICVTEQVSAVHFVHFLLVAHLKWKVLTGQHIRII